MAPSGADDVAAPFHDVEGAYSGPRINARTASLLPARTAALPTSGLYYRTHDHSRPFTPEDATSSPLWSLSEAPTKKGYSCLENPWDLWVYILAYGWMQPRYIANDDVICFSGTPKRGKGNDGEPLVVPDMKTVRRMSWPEFEKHLLATPRPAVPGGPGAKRGYFDNWLIVGNSCFEKVSFSAVARALADEALVSIGMEPKFSSASQPGVYDVIRPEDLRHYGSKTAANGVWYHASRKRLPVGTALRALDEPRYPLAVPGKVYFTPDPYVAATHIGGITRFYDEGVNKSYLYQVEPIGEIEDDPEVHYAGAQFYGAAYMADDAVVVRVLTPGNGLEEVLDQPPQKYLRAASKADALGAKVAAEDHSEHAMICLRPSEATRKVLADMDVTTEDVDDIHITLHYLGTLEEAGGEWGKERIYRGIYDFAIHSGYHSLTGKANGVGAFLNDDANVLITLWDIPRIAEFRTHLMEALVRHGHQPREENHGFTPHATLAYLDAKPDSLPVLPDLDEETFGSVWLVWGEEWTEVVLG